MRPYVPLNTLKPVGEDIWIVDGPEIGFDYLGATIPFPTRMTVVRLASGDLWLHSPIAFDEALAASLTAIGPIRYLIAPNTIHYWYVPDWKARCPGAEVHAVPNLLRRAKRPFAIDHPLVAWPAAAWPDDFDQDLFTGDVVTEAVFHHRASRTLILTDLIENFELERVESRLLRAVLKLGGAADPDGKAPFDMRLSFWRNRKRIRASARRMLDWAPERVIMAHGRWYERDGTAELRRAFRWAL
ncbi:DUF4336 domain-containing protein [Sphingomonas gilva]|uniref:DUF4336 domain-containing protein n=1 Tax=Sphingomonas gilva TaxID=2305907 RepID=A0A396RJJ5_9SPHN|nr:DUF4336 domain-containing protein [Sphingomonas gilva]RHW16328.1 DUF4336 domain-containing protein [Sphingomonas gilva]